MLEMHSHQHFDSTNQLAPDGCPIVSKQAAYSSSVRTNKSYLKRTVVLDTSTRQFPSDACPTHAKFTSYNTKYGLVKPSHLDMLIQNTSTTL